MPNEHIVQAFDAELDNLRTSIVDMGKMVREQLRSSTTALVAHDLKRAKEVISYDKKIDKLELELATQATQIFAIRQPMAADLRMIVASLKISSNLERMGDYSKNISKRTITLDNIPLLGDTGARVLGMADLVHKMISDVMDAFVERDADKAVSVIRQDTEVDRLHTNLFREILTYMMADPNNVNVCTHLLFIAKNIERMGDHATNIAEQAYYVKTGTFVEDERDKNDKSTSVVVEK